MWYSTKLTEALQIKYPIIQAGMAGGPTTAELVAAVSNAGGLGTLGAGYMTASALREDIKKIRTLTDHPFGVNLFVPEPTFIEKEKIAAMRQKLEGYFTELSANQPDFDESNLPNFEEQIQVILEEQVPVFSCTFGILEEKWIKALKEANIYVIGTATTVDEAILVEKNGMDAVVAQGSEAGGHRGTFACDSKKGLVGTMALIPQMVDAVNIPVISAGGIMDERGVIASLALGATGVQMGTAFLTAKESGTNPVHREALLNSTEASTVTTKVFSGKLARGIDNRFIQEMESSEIELPAYPIQHVITQPLRKEAGAKKQADFMSLWSGQGGRLSRDESATDIMKRIVTGASQIVHSMNE